MLAKELSSKIEWSDLDEYRTYYGELAMSSHILGNDFRVSFDVPESGSSAQLPVAALANLDYFLNVGEAMKAAVGNMLFQNFTMWTQSSVPNIEVREGETETEANIRHFRVYSPEDAFREANLLDVFISVDGGITPSAQLYFGIPWDEEHGARLEILRENEVYPDD